MCRLYAFRSTEETRVECTLVHAQNALMAQSRQDRSGLSHAHGWGMVAWAEGEPDVQRQAWAAYHGEHFSRAAARIWSTAVIAHVRRATVGEPAIENTHPFVDGALAFVHNGTLPRFDELKPRLLDETDAAQRAAIAGQTDSEHLFRHALSLRDANPDLSLAETLLQVVANVERWTATLDGAPPVGLNLVLGDGVTLAGTRWGRTLYRTVRRGVYDCEICGFPHIQHTPDRDHRAVVVASEPITHENWHEVPERSLWTIDADAGFDVVPL